MNITNNEESTPLISRHGIPVLVRDTRTDRQKQLAIYFILATTVFERLAFYSLTTNIELTLKSMANISQWNPFYSSMSLLYTFYGICYLSTLFFAIISDRFFGRGKTILIGFVLYSIGYSLITIAVGNENFASCHRNTSIRGISLTGGTCNTAILVIVIVIAIGAGALKSNLAVFGADQIQESKITSRYFDKYVVAVNIGTAIALSIIPYVINTEKDMLIAYEIALPTPFVAMLLFAVGWPFYIHVLANETVIANSFPVMINACQSRYKYMKTRSVEKKKSRSSALLNASQSMSEDDRLMGLEGRPVAFLDFAKVPYGKYHDRIVDDVKSLRGALIVFTLLMPYWLLYDQTKTMFSSQGKSMSGTDLGYMVSLVSIFDPITIIVSVLILNIFIYKCLEARNWSLSITKRLVIGMLIACLCMCIAGTIEAIRQTRCLHDQKNLSIFLQIPQYLSIGLSETFTMVASYEYAYYAAPFSAQSLFMSLNFCSAGLASFINVAYMAIVSQESMNIDFSCPSINVSWPSYGYFFIFGGIQLLATIILILCQKKFQVIKFNAQQIESNQFLPR